MEGYGTPEGGGWVRVERDFNFTLLYGLVLVAIITVSIMFVDMFVININPEDTMLTPFWFLVMFVIVYSSVVVVYATWQDRYWGTFWVTYSREWRVEFTAALEAVKERLAQREVEYKEHPGRAGLPRTRGVRLELEEFRKIDVEVHLVHKDLKRPERGVVAQVISSVDDMELLDDIIMDIEAAMSKAAGGDGVPDLVLHDE
jgi:hypothetical protein